MPPPQTRLLASISIFGPWSLHYKLPLCKCLAIAGQLEGYVSRYNSHTYSSALQTALTEDADV